MSLRWIPFIAALAAASCLAQQPQVSLHLDLWPNFRTSRDGESIFRWYNDTGHYSTASVTILTEVGFRVFVSQRMQRIDNDTDNELFNEYYVEDTGYWRVGKQLLPFGLALLEREFARAARVNTNLAVGGWPVQLAWCDAGEGKQKGVVGRIGSAIGVSVAAGDHFGIAGTAFNDVRKPEDALPQGAGYRLLLGADAVQHVGRATYEAEWVRSRLGHTAADADNDYALLAIDYHVEGPQRASFAWARDVASSIDSYRLRFEMTISPNVQLVPQVRWRAGRLFETSIGLHYKL